MKSAALILSIILVVVNADTSKWLDFRVKFAPNGSGVDVNSFWKVHNTLNEALAGGWIRVDNENELNAITVCKSQQDVRVCPLYDAKGFIAGMQLAAPAVDVENPEIPYDFQQHKVFSKKMINGEYYWTSTYYLVEPEIISNGGRPEASTLGNGLWLKNGTTYTEVYTDEESIKTKTSYTWQNCIPNMGKHYYFNMTPELECEYMEPFFLLVKDGNMIGVGWQFFGKTNYINHNWYDDINNMAARLTIPLGPKCLHEGPDKYGVISVHMYFVETPWAIPCDQDTESVVPIKP